MPENPAKSKRSLTPDWFVQGLLTRIGDTMDRLLGRDWKPASSLATSEIIERLKALLDSEAQETPTKAKFVPHNITLKMQWDKFSADESAGLRTLENELLTAAVDHINDRRYYTYAPLSIQVKPDYFTTGVKLHAGFDKFNDEQSDAEVNVTVPGILLDRDGISEPAEAGPINILAQHSVDGRTVVTKLQMAVGTRLSIGRTKESGLTIDDPSVSKLHASLMLGPSEGLSVADTGSTNGTFVNDVRIPYGTAVEFASGDRLRFGSVDVTFEIVRAQHESVDNLADASAYHVGDMEFRNASADKVERPSGKPDARGSNALSNKTNKVVAINAGPEDTE